MWYNQLPHFISSHEQLDQGIGYWSDLRDWITKELEFNHLRLPRRSMNALIEEEMKMNLIRRMQYLLSSMNSPFLILPIDKPLFHGLSCAQLSGFYQLFTHLFILFAWFYISFLIMCFDWKHASLILYLLIINPLLLPLDALICVLSDFRDYRAGMAQRMERKHAKVEGIQEVGEIAKLSSLTSSHSNGYNFSYRGPNDAVPVALES